MGLLDGGLERLFGAVFGIAYLDGTLWRRSPTLLDAGGSVVAGTGGFEPLAVKLQPDAATEAMQTLLGTTASDVRILVLTHGLAGGIGSDDEIEVLGGRHAGRYSIHEPGLDAAGTHYELRGQRIAADADG